MRDPVDVGPSTGSRMPFIGHACKGRALGQRTAPAARGSAVTLRRRLTATGLTHSPEPRPLRAWTLHNVCPRPMPVSVQEPTIRELRAGAFFREWPDHSLRSVISVLRPVYYRMGEYLTVQGMPQADAPSFGAVLLVCSAVPSSVRT